jgi:anti-anti-sigma factor
MLLPFVETDSRLEIASPWRAFTRGVESMSLYILAHPWQVQDVADGTLVPISHRDLDVETLSIFADELCELAHENNLPRLYLDFQRVTSLTSVALGKLFAVNRRLKDIGVRLIVCNLSPELQAILHAVNGSTDSTPTHTEPGASANRQMS